MTAPESFPHWHILGAGAIGGLWALRLQALDRDVTLIERAASVTRRRLCLSDNHRERCHDFSVMAADSLPQSLSPLLVTTKAGDTAIALQPLLPLLHPGDTVILFQNGMGVDDWLRQIRPDLLLLTAITTDGVYRQDRNTLVMAGHGTTLIGGESPEEQHQARHIAGLWRQSCARVEAVDDMRQRRWQKLAINCAINPLTGRYRCRNGDLLEKPEALLVMRTLCDEVAAVMRAEGLPAEGQALFDIACQVAHQTAANTSSMLADVLAGRPTEIDFMNGHVVRTGEKHRLGCPANAAITTEIHALATSREMPCL